MLFWLQQRLASARAFAALNVLNALRALTALNALTSSAVWAALVAVAAFTTGTTISAAPEYPALGLNVFDPEADGMAAVDAALARAASEKKQVLLLFGTNGCRWCHRLNDVLEADPALITALQRDLVLVKVDVNAKDGARRNRDVVERFDDATRLGLPALLLLDATGRLRARQGIGPWQSPDKKGFDRAKVLATFAAWTARPR